MCGCMDVCVGFCAGVGFCGGVGVGVYRCVPVCVVSL